MCYECLQSHLDILDENDDTESMVLEVIGEVKMPHTVKKTFPMLNVGIGHTNRTTQNVKSYLI